MGAPGPDFGTWESDNLSVPYLGFLPTQCRAHRKRVPCPESAFALRRNKILCWDYSWVSGISAFTTIEIPKLTMIARTMSPLS